jgi:hypothetical protein
MLKNVIKQIIPVLCCVILSTQAYAYDHNQLSEEIYRAVRTSVTGDGEYLLHIGPNGITVYQLSAVDHGPQNIICPFPYANTTNTSTTNTKSPENPHPNQNSQTMTFPNALVVIYPEGSQGSQAESQQQSSMKNPATHGDAVMMLMNMASLLPEGEALTVNDAKYWETHTQTAASHGIITPGSDGTFHPERPITWGELALYLNRVFKLPENLSASNQPPNVLVSQEELAQMAVDLYGYVLKDLRALPYKN